LLTIGPTVGALTVIEIVLEAASIILGVFRQPVFRVFILGPVVHAEEVGPSALAPVVLPLADIEAATPVPERATSTSYPFQPATFIIGALVAGDHFRQLAKAVIPAILEVAAIGVHADIGGDFQRTVAIDTVTAEA